MILNDAKLCMWQPQKTTKPEREREKKKTLSAVKKENLTL